VGVQSASEISPRRGAGFRADVKTDGEHLRLFAQVEEQGWIASVYNMNRRKWIAGDDWASDAADAKRRAEHRARYFIPGEYEITWVEIHQQD